MKRNSHPPSNVDNEGVALAPSKDESEFLSRRGAIASLTMLVIGPHLPIPEVDERLVIVDGWVMKKSELPQE